MRNNHAVRQKCLIVWMGLYKDLRGSTQQWIMALRMVVFSIFIFLFYCTPCRAKPDNWNDDHSKNAFFLNSVSVLLRKLWEWSTCIWLGTKVTIHWSHDRRANAVSAIKLWYPIPGYTDSPSKRYGRRIGRSVWRLKDWRPQKNFTKIIKLIQMLK